MLSRARLSAVLMPSPLLTYPESSSESSDSDDDLNRVCEEEFAQLFDIPKRIPKASGYVGNVVRMYSDKEVGRLYRIVALCSEDAVFISFAGTFGCPECRATP
uniref:Uncharacterized protein n=1 Tax=Rhipicephalus zambeziensis TaxID=60191 RepID=A0A224YRE5_9ACAR